MHSPELLDHFRSPRNAGELPPPAVTVEVENPACGDVLRLWALLQEDRFDRVTFKARGCSASIAAGSVATLWLQDRTISEAARIQPAEVEGPLGGLPAASKHAAQLVVDGIKALCQAAAAAKA